MAAVEEADTVTDTVVKTVGEKVGVIEESVAAVTGDDAPPSLAVAASQASLGKCELMRTCNGR